MALHLPHGNRRDAVVKPFLFGLMLAGSVAMATHGVGIIQAAEEGAKNGRLYGAAGIGMSRLSPDEECFCLEVSEENDLGGSLAIGFDVNRWLSLEAYYADLGAAPISFLGTDVGEVDYTVYGVDALAYLYNPNRPALGQRHGLSLYARLGVGGMSNDSDLNYDQNHATHVNVGAGIEYGWRNGFALRGEVQSYDTDAQLAQMVLLKRFGGMREAAAAPATAARLPEPASNPVASPSTPLLTASVDPSAVIAAGRVGDDVLFDLDQSVLRVDQGNRLAYILRMARSNPALDLRIEGHTDWTASERYNIGLSKRRALAVRQYLIDNGISETRLDVVGFGESRPVADNRSLAGRAQNRRVEVHVAN